MTFLLLVHVNSCNVNCKYRSDMSIQLRLCRCFIREVISNKRLLRCLCNFSVCISNYLRFEPYHELAFDLQPHLDAPVKWSEHTPLPDSRSPCWFFWEREYEITCLQAHKHGHKHPVTACQQNDMPYFGLRCICLQQWHITRKVCSFSRWYILFCPWRKNTVQVDILFQQ